MLYKKMNNYREDADIFFKTEYLISNKEKKRDLEALLRDTLSFDYPQAAKKLAQNSAQYCAGFLTFIYADTNTGLFTAEPWQTIEAVFKLLGELENYPAADTSQYPSLAAEIVATLDNNPGNAVILKNLLSDAQNEKHQPFLQPYELMLVLDRILLSYRKESSSFYRKYQ